MVWLNLAYNIIKCNYNNGSKIKNTLTKTRHLLGYKLRCHGLLLLESSLMVWGSKFGDTVKKLEDLTMNTGFQFLVQWVSIAHRMHRRWTAHSPVHLQSLIYSVYYVGADGNLLQAVQ